MLSTLVSLPRLPLVLVAALGALVSACADPKQSFDEFVGRSPPPPPPGACPEAYVAQAPGQMDGEYLLTLSASVNAVKPILFIANITTVAEGAGLGMGMTIQALTVADQTPVGPVRDEAPVPVGDDGSFTLDLPDVEIPKDANALTPADAAADTVFEGSVCGDGGFLCGDVTGMTTKPVSLDLAGSTFTFQRIEDPAAYPEPILDCKGTTVPPAM